MGDFRLPTFICIGAAKCGTTSLWRYLGEHPDVCVSTPKETDFFLEENEKTEEWYRGCFKQEATAYGEASTKYTKIHGDSGVPKRMHDLLPNLKLLYLVRDPIDRAISEYMHNAALGWETGTKPADLEEAFCPVEESWYLKTSRYYFQLAPYLEYYSKENILVVQFERFRDHPEDVMEEVFQFIDVNPDEAHDESNLSQKHHITSRKLKRPKIYKKIVQTRIGSVFRKLIKNNVSRDTIDWIKGKIRDNDLLETIGEKPTPSKDVLLRARGYLHEDVERLRTFTGKEFQNWSV